MLVPEIQFVDGDDGSIAFQELGTGGPAVVYMPNWGNTIEAIWESPSAEKVLRRLGAVGRLVVFDRRGTGVSDPLRASYTSASDLGGLIEEAVTDLILVLDHLEIDRASLVANLWGTSVALLAAATQPDRVTSLVLINPTPRWRKAPDYPWGLADDLRILAANTIRTEWGGPTAPSIFNVPTMRHDERFRRWLARYERLSIPRGTLANNWDSMDVDLRPVLNSIQCPTLVMHHLGNGMYDPGAAAFTVDHIRGADGPIAIDTPDLEIYAPQPETAITTMTAFVSGSAEHRPSVETDRVFAVILFTDIVESTSTAAALGDRRWRDLLEVHNSVVARQTVAFRGRVVKSTGDGVLATFDGPARAIRCAEAIAYDLGRIGVVIRAGVHAGEVEVIGEDIGGIAVHICQRISTLAAPGEIMVSRTIVDLVAGSELAFSDGEQHKLKGVPGTWTVCALRATR